MSLVITPLSKEQEEYLRFLGTLKLGQLKQKRFGAEENIKRLNAHKDFKNRYENGANPFSESQRSLDKWKCRLILINQEIERRTDGKKSFNN